MNKYLLYPTADTMLQLIQKCDAVYKQSQCSPASQCPRTKCEYVPPYLLYTIPALHTTSPPHMREVVPEL